MTAFSARALGAVAEVAGASIPQHLPVLMPPLLEACASAVRNASSRLLASAADTRCALRQDAAVADTARAAAQSIILSVDEGYIYQAVAELLRGMEDARVGCRAASARLTGFYVQEAAFDLSSHMETIIGAPVQAYASHFTGLTRARIPSTGALVSQLADVDTEVVRSAWTALVDVTAKIPKEELHLYVHCLRDAVNTARDKVRARQVFVCVRIC